MNYSATELLLKEKGMEMQVTKAEKEKDAAATTQVELEGIIIFCNSQSVHLLVTL